MSPQQVIQCWLGFDLIHQDVGGSLRAVFDLRQNLPELFTIEVVPSTFTLRLQHEAVGVSDGCGSYSVTLFTLAGKDGNRWTPGIISSWTGWFHTGLNWMESPPLEVFKEHLDVARSALVWVPR